MLHKGIDSFDYNPGEVKEMRCIACGSLCEVDRNVTGPTGFAEAMGKKGHLHDHFYCPNADQDWHDLAVRLVKAMEETPSKRLRSLMQEDLKDLLEMHGLK